MDNNGRATRIPAMDFADTGRWHLIVYISGRSVQAWLRPNDGTIEGGAELFRTEWEENGESPLREIENAVYDNPRVLDDFSADIIIETPRTLWVPEEVADTPGNQERIFTQVWPDDPDEMSVDDEVRGAVCLYQLTPGLKGFLQRTFPGTRISCHQSWLVRHFSKQRGDDPAFLIDIRDNEADIIAFASGRLTACVTHPWSEVTDILWHIFNILDLNSLDPSTAQVFLTGLKGAREALSAELAPHIGLVAPAESPRQVDIPDMPLAAMICYNKNLTTRS